MRRELMIPTFTPLQLALALVAFLALALGVVDVALETNMRDALYYQVGFFSTIADNAPITGILTAGAFAIVSGILSLSWAYFLAMPKRSASHDGLLDGKQQARLVYRTGFLACLLALTNVMVIMVALPVVFVKESRSSRWHYVDDLPPDGLWTIAWYICQLPQSHLPRWDGEWVVPACRKANAARWLLIPLFLISLPLAGLAMATSKEYFASKNSAEVYNVQFEMTEAPRDGKEDDMVVAKEGGMGVRYV